MNSQSIRFPVPEKEFDYWMGRMAYEYEVLSSDYMGRFGFIDGKLVFT
jgi:hypothetical protein